jgi:hypothetical protein
MSGKHPSVTQESTGMFRIYHSKLNGKSPSGTSLLDKHCADLTLLSACPCDENGSFLDDLTQKPISEPSKTASWEPFEDRLAFEWAHEYYVELKASKKRIAKGLELWRAALLKGDVPSDVPWKSAQEMYDTIDAIQEGDNPWLTYEFRYAGPRPASTAPQWMDATYELNVRDVLVLLEEMLSNKDFDGHFDTTPFRNYNSKGERVWSNFMSGDWAADEAVFPSLFFFVVMHELIQLTG